MSRIVGGERLLGESEREVLRGMLWQVAGFCGVRILTYAVMSNHFHVLLFVPRKEPISDAELLRRYALLYGESRAPWQPSPEVLEAMLEENSGDGKEWRERLLARMGDVSAFMKTVKQRFSVWYNRHHGRYGTLWADRFKSVLVEGDPQALATVAAYIDLNPVRAGLVEDPGAYRWCGYGEAMGGGRAARNGLGLVFGQPSTKWKATVASYRRLIFGLGSGGATTVGKIDRSRALKVIQQGGRVTVPEALRFRIRYFTDGAVLGSKAFVQSWIDANKLRSIRPRRLEPRPMVGAEWHGLTVSRPLRREVFS